jgi:hypothetical protein
MPGKNSVRIRVSLYSLRKKPALPLILGGAAVYRCGLPCFEFGFSR